MKFAEMRGRILGKGKGLASLTKQRRICIFNVEIFYCRMKQITILSTLGTLVATGSLVFGAPKEPTEGVVMEVWEGIKSSEISSVIDTAKNKAPHSVFVKPNVDDEALGLDDFGARYSALITAPETGEFTFYLAADDLAELWLSSDENAANVKKVCQVPHYMPQRQFLPRCSGKVSLQKGQKYFMQLYFKDIVNEEHVALAWEGPGITKQIIDKKYFEPKFTDKSKEIWVRTVEQEKRCIQLEKEMRNQAISRLPEWLDKLDNKDKTLLTSKLRKARESAERKKPEECQKALRSYMAMARGINASPENPVNNPVAKQLLYMEAAWLNTLTDVQLEKYGAHRLASALGDIPQSAKRGKATLKFNSKGDKWREEFVSVGLYAMPGKPVEVTIPEEFVGKLQMHVGHHFPTKEETPLVCMPNTNRVFPLKQAKTKFTTPHGGLMLLRVPKEVALNETPITINGAIRAPRFILGKHTDEDWAKLSNAPAPWGELVSEHLVMVVSREQLRSLTNPTELMKWWNENNRDLEDFYSYYPGVPFRMHGGHYAREGVSYWPLEWNPKNMDWLLDVNKMREVNSALFLHEHGHHSDFWEMELSFWAESTTNWGGYYLRERNGAMSFNWKDSHDLHLRKLFDPNDKGMQEIMQEKWYKISSKGTHHWSYPITSMMIGYAETFGWERVKEVIKRIRDTKGDMYSWDFVKGADDDQAKIDRYLIGLSEAAQRDVCPYFAHFKLFPSEGAAKYIANLGLKKWDLTYLVQPEEKKTKKNVSLTIPCAPEKLLSFAKGSKVEWEPSSAKGGRVTINTYGNAVYSPKPGFAGKDIITYTLSNEYGNVVTKKMEIAVE